MRTNASASRSSREHARERAGVSAPDAPCASAQQAAEGFLERCGRHEPRLVGAEVVERELGLADRPFLQRDEREIRATRAARLDGPRAGIGQPSARSVSTLMLVQFSFGW